jgi:hypothetical protein
MSVAATENPVKQLLDASSKQMAAYGPKINENHLAKTLYKTDHRFIVDSGPDVLGSPPQTKEVAYERNRCTQRCSTPARTSDLRAFAPGAFFQYSLLQAHLENWDLAYPPAIVVDMRIFTEAIFSAAMHAQLLGSLI